MHYIIMSTGPILVKEVVVPVPVTKAIRIIHNILWWGEMKCRTIGITRQGIPSFSKINYLGILIQVI